MNKTQIKEGRTYETKVGIGVCLKAGGTFPWTAVIDIKHPFPRGKCNVQPRDVLREIPTPTVPAPTDHIAAPPRAENTKPYVENYPPLHTWLRTIEARCDWQLPLGGERNPESGEVENPRAYVECWRLPTGHAFIIVVTTHGWDIFTSAGTNKIDATLSDANLRLRMPSGASHEGMSLDDALAGVAQGVINIAEMKGEDAEPLAGKRGCFIEADSRIDKAMRTVLEYFGDLTRVEVKVKS